MKIFLVKNYTYLYFCVKQLSALRFTNAPNGTLLIVDECLKKFQLDSTSYLILPGDVTKGFRNFLSTIIRISLKSNQILIQSGYYIA